MRVLSPRGRIYKVNEVIPLAEKKETFNERVTVVREPASSMDVMPTAINFKLKADNYAYGTMNIVVGNLTPDNVRVILSFMLTDGYVDLSNYEYQNVNICDVKKLKVDGGKSLPYFEENCPDFDFSANLPKFGRPGMSDMVSGFDDDSDSEDDAEDDVKDGAFN